MEQKTQEVHEEMIAFIKEYTFKMLQQPSSSQTLLNVLSKILLQKLKVYGKEMVTLFFSINSQYKTGVRQGINCFT